MHCNAPHTGFACYSSNMDAKYARLSILHEASEHAAWCHVRHDDLKRLETAYRSGRLVVSPEDFACLLEAQRAALLRSGNLGVLMATMSQEIGRPSLREAVGYWFRRIARNAS